MRDAFGDGMSYIAEILRGECFGTEAGFAENVFWRQYGEDGLFLEDL